MNAKTNVVKKDNARVEINIEIPVENMEAAYKKELASFTKTFKMPGFREGKAPVDLIEKKYKPHIQTEAIEHALTEAYRAALIENRLTPYSQPEFSQFDIDLTKPLKVTISFDMFPTVALGEYKGLSVIRDTCTVSDGDIDHSLEHLQQEHAELLPRTEGVKDNDIVVIDMIGSKDNVEVPELKMNNQRFEVKKGFIPDDMYKGLLGLKKGEEKEILVKYPSDYFVKAVAGQKIDFKVKVNDVLEKKIPELNDEFAKDLGTFQTLVELKNDIKSKLELEASRHEEGIFENRILDEIASASKFGIPDSYVTTKIEENLEGLKQQLHWRNMPLENYFEQLKTTEEKVREDFKTRIIEDTKRSLVWLEIARAEKIQVSDEDMEARIKEIASSSKQSEDQIRTYFEKEDKRSDMRTDILYKKVLASVRASVKEKKGKQIKYSELHNHQEG